MFLSGGAPTSICYFFCLSVCWLFTQASAYGKQGHATIACLATKLRLETCEKLYATCQGGMWWCAMIIPFRIPYCSFFLQWDLQTMIKLKLKQTPKEFQKEFHCKKIRARPAKIFFTLVSQFCKAWGNLKRLKNGFH